MEYKRIIYYTKGDKATKTLSLRNLCIKEEYDAGLETIFYLVRDTVGTDELVDKLNLICYESFSLERDDISCVLIKVIDCYNHTNYLKIRKVQNNTMKEPQNDNH